MSCRHGDDIILSIKLTKTIVIAYNIKYKAY